MVTLIGAALAALRNQAQPAPNAPNSPIIVKVISPPTDPTGIADVIVGSIGLTGAITLLAIVLGLVMAGILYWVRSRNPLSH
jgi:ABC-type phosphate transport system permease subunit